MPVVSFDICQRKDCEGFEFIETTGLFSATNPDGYGVSEDLSAYTGRLEIYDWDATTVKAVYTVTPTSDKSLRQAVLYAAAGITDLSYGVYKVIYKVMSGSTVTYSSTKYLLVYCDLACKINAALMKAKDGCSCCDATSVLNAKYSLMAAAAKFNEGQWKSAEADLSHVHYILNNECNC